MMMPLFPEHPILTNAGMCSWEHLYEVVEHEFDEYKNKNPNPYVNFNFDSGACAELILLR